MWEVYTHHPGSSPLLLKLNCFHLQCHIANEILELGEVVREKIYTGFHLSNKVPHVIASNPIAHSDLCRINQKAIHTHQY